MKRSFKYILGIVIILGIAVFYFVLFSAPESNAEAERFIVPLGADFTEIAPLLKSDGFIKSDIGFNITRAIRGFSAVQPGGYKISKSMNAWQIVGALSKEPYMKWVKIPEGLRKEEIAGILRERIGWSNVEESEWISESTTKKSDYIEGVYFPDTYLIPVAETPDQVAQRFQLKFQEKFAPYAKEAIKQNIKWTTLLKIASLVQREAAGADDMPIIAGVLWNRLLKNMKLDIDATVQYARGKTEKGWWTPITPSDKKNDSPYNTYIYKGLPPYPISNPGLGAINAALNPAQTDCIYYLHDAQKQIHCSKTYEEHQKNIEKYLR